MRLSEELAENCPHGGINKEFWQVWIRTIFVAVK
jgi:hypothetical protein